MQDFDENFSRFPFEYFHITVVEGRNVPSNIRCTITSSESQEKHKFSCPSVTNWNYYLKFSNLQHSSTVTIKIREKAESTDSRFSGSLNLNIGELVQGKQVEKWFPIESSLLPQPEILLRFHTSCSAEKLGIDLTTHEFGKRIGSGSFSEVRLAWKKDDQEQQCVAIKIVSKFVMGPEDLALVHREIEVMKRLNHDHIVQLYDWQETRDKIFLILEFVDGGELYDAIIEKTCFSEKETVDVITQILETVKYFHDLNIAHRDLKPDNLLLCGKKEKSIIKIADWGFSKDFSNSAFRMRSSLGTPAYVAPEVLTGEPYGPQCDIWSIGVITYTLLCGFGPFNQETIPEQLEAVMEGKFTFPSPEWDTVSEEAKDFVRKILVVDPILRSTAQQCLQHPWLQSLNAPEFTCRS